MGVDRLRVAVSHMRRMIEWCLKCRPREACGLLGGLYYHDSDWLVAEVRKVYTIANVEQRSPKTRYFMDPRGQWQAMRDAERRGMDIVGAFHSHVASPAYPSDIDVELAQYPGWAWVVVSLAYPDPEVRAFSIEDGDVDEIEIVVAGARP